MKTFRWVSVLGLAALLLGGALLTLPARAGTLHPANPAARPALPRPELGGGGVVSKTVGNLDVVLALDTSGSTEYDTICYGCWERCGDSSLITTTECTAADRYKPYPANGKKFPLPYPPRSGPPNTVQQRMLDLIVGDDGDGSVWPPVPGTPDPLTGTNYIIFEAEFYSNNGGPSWDPGERAAGKGYWAIQRATSTDGSSGGGFGNPDNGQALAIDGYGYEGTAGTYLNGLVRHHPMTENTDGKIFPYGRHYTQTNAEANISPRLEYDFVPTWGSQTYIHFKGQFYHGANNTLQPNEFFWAIYDAASGKNVYPGPAGSTAVLQAWGGAENDHWDPRPDRHWRWFSVNTGGAVLTPTRKYTLKIWAGSGGYAFDRMIVTARVNVFSPDNLTHAPATPGTAQRLAADPCNPIFGLSVQPADCTVSYLLAPVNNLDDPLFGAMQPARGMLEAARSLMTQYLDPHRDQVGLVDFDSDAGQVAQLECLRAAPARRLGANAPAAQSDLYPLNTLDGYPALDEYTCADPAQAAPGTLPISYTAVVRGLEQLYPPGGGTDIADALRRSLHMLGVTTDNDGAQANNCDWRWATNWWQIRQENGLGGTDQPWEGYPKMNPSGHCGRSSGAHPLIILLTDGTPTDGTPGDNSECTTWGDTNPLPYPAFPITNNKYECVMYYADIAAQNNIPICTVGLSSSADPYLLQAVADRTGGQFFFVPVPGGQPDFLDQVVEICMRSRGANVGVGQQRTGPPQNYDSDTPIRYTLTVSHTGPVFPVTATLVNSWSPAGSVAGALAPGCAVDVPGRAITCVYPNLQIGQVATTPVTLTPTVGFSGTLQTSVTITTTPGLPDSDPGNNSDNLSQIVVSYPPEMYYLPVIVKEAAP
ncbi:MAG: VWA domain-containing protein [Chloroflexi bacterium]|nr:MAG: VWA domain-containing protein [Chloroflexota bacterium]